ncbi:hypothetical protein [Serratia marcescens]|uniref:hypothetical protein n=1 Tax=Serratia marcescens TaxID=615 RepID=UPI00148CEEAE|nr:hypothetical protein [Serratia marcescens]QJU39665.1 hypothetical protein HMI62_10200 [Serratia marcescens]
MARNIEVKINDIPYVGSTASAKDQVEMLQIASRCGLLPAISDNVTPMGVVASLAAVEASSLNRLKVLCLTNGNIVRQSDNVPVAENMFQDEAHNFLGLIGGVLKENIGPFWQLSGSEKTSPNAAAETQE